MKERITISIDSETLEYVDKMIDGREIRNRSHAIEHILSRMNRDIDTALILAGGDTFDGPDGEIPKALIPINGKPVVEHHIETLKSLGIERVILAVDRLAGSIEKRLGDSYNGVRIEYNRNKNPAGTAGALNTAAGMIDHTFVVMNADTLVKPDLKEMYKFHAGRDSVATMLLVTADDTSESGVVLMKGNDVTDFSEKPDTAESKLVNAGFYIMEPSIFRYAPKKGNLEKSVFPKLVKARKLSGFLHDGPMIDVGTKDGCERAEQEWK